MQFVLLVLVVFSSPPGNPLEEGMACYNRLDYPCAVERLKTAVSICQMMPADEEVTERLTTALKYLGFSYVALGEEALARDAFRELLAVSPETVLDAFKISPKIVKVFEEVRVSLGIKEKPNQKSDRSLSVGVAGGVAMLFGRDADVYTPGPQLDISAGYPLGKGFSAILSAEYHFHAISQADGRGGLHALSLVACMKYSPFYSDLSPFLIAGAGPSVFGRVHLDDKWAMGLKTGVGVDYELARSVRLLAGVFPSWNVSTASGAVSTSFFLTLTVGAGTEF